MDSGNSGSMQSSSGEEEEYDSRAESISALLNSSGQIRSTMLNPPPTSHHQSHHPPLFDSFSNYLDTFPRSPPPPPNLNSFLNLDMAWARGLRSEPNSTEIGGVMGSSSSSAPPISGPQGSNRTHPYISPCLPLQSASENGGRPSPSTDPPNVIRNSKKRSRASRRAPTTVLTTDTSNFRAMVQEFTGIPAPPFTASSFPRTRLDLFNTASALRSGLSDPPPPPYLLRPFAHKIQQPRPSFASFPSLNSSSPSSSSTMFDAVTSSTTANSIGISTNGTCNNTTGTTLASTSNHQQNNLLNMQNPMLAFQSLLQSPPKYPTASSSAFGGKDQGPMTIGPTDSQLKMGMLQDFSMNHGHVKTPHGGSTLVNLIASHGMSSRSDDPPSWGDGVGSSDGDQSHLRSFDGNYTNSQRVSSCKMNFTSSSSDFHVEKGTENVSSRGEGMVDSWICSSD